jgi:ferredoxin
MCVAIAPDRFVLDQPERSGPVESEIGQDELVRDAAASLPSEAISLADADARQPGRPRLMDGPPARPM